MWQLLRGVVEAMEHPTEDPLYYQNLCLRCQFVEKPNSKSKTVVKHLINILLNSGFEDQSTHIGPKSD